MLVVVICFHTVLVRIGLMGEVPTALELVYLRDDLLWGLAFAENFNMVWRANDYFADTSKP